MDVTPLKEQNAMRAYMLIALMKPSETAIVNVWLKHATSPVLEDLDGYRIGNRIYQSALEELE